MSGYMYLLLRKSHLVKGSMQRESFKYEPQLSVETGRHKTPRIQSSISNDCVTRKAQKRLE